MTNFPIIVVHFKYLIIQYVHRMTNENESKGSEKLKKIWSHVLIYMNIIIISKYYRIIFFVSWSIGQFALPANGETLTNIEQVGKFIYMILMKEYRTKTKIQSIGSMYIYLLRFCISIIFYSAWQLCTFFRFLRVASTTTATATTLLRGYVRWRARIPYR